MSNTLIRVGIVSDRNVAEGTVKVTFEDQDNMVTDWLPVVVAKNLENSSTAIPNINDTVVCAFLASGLEDGFCLGVLHGGG
ncbi:MAG: hypothetical protein ACE3L7_04175 [Candidatus Pristimantibacillus sp.]